MRWPLILAVFTPAFFSCATQHPEPEVSAIGNGDSSIRRGDVAAARRDDGNVQFKIFTGTGFVGFTVGGEWSVLLMKSDLPVAIAAFQIPNLGDAETPHSTNLSLQFYQLG